MTMKTPLFVGMVLLLTGSAVLAQSVQVRVLDSLNREPLVGVTIQVNTKPVSGAVTNTEGIAQFTGLPTGSHQLKVSYLGYKPYSRTINLPADSLLTIRLASAADELDVVTVSATRTNRRIEDLPVKVEVLGQEDMDEEAAVVPGNVGSILGDISIIHLQRTSLPTGNEGIRMQGIAPKYTQILRDGLPLYEGFSGNLGVLQIPPLDLKQVEIVKGSASTLYGGGAIGGLINLVSRKPGSEPELTVVANRSNLRESNLNIYGSKQLSEKVGFTMFAGYTNQPAVDVNGDGFSDVPLIHQFDLHPRLFLTFNTRNKLNAGYSFVTERRDGGYVSAVNNPGANPDNLYTLNNNLNRHTGDATSEHRFTDRHSLTTRGTVSYFDRRQTDGGYRFDGRQLSGYAELADNYEHGPHSLVAGMNVTHEQFTKGGYRCHDHPEFHLQHRGRVCTGRLHGGASS